MQAFACIHKTYSKTAQWIIDNDKCIEDPAIFRSLSLSPFLNPIISTILPNITRENIFLFWNNNFNINRMKKTFFSQKHLIQIIIWHIMSIFYINEISFFNLQSNTSFFFGSVYDDIAASCVYVCVKRFLEWMFNQFNCIHIIK